MLVTRISPLTNHMNSMELDITPEQLKQWEDGMLIQDAMPNLTAGEREFLLSGLLEDEFDSLFSDME